MDSAKAHPLVPKHCRDDRARHRDARLLPSDVVSPPPCGAERTRLAREAGGVAVCEHLAFAVFALVDQLADQRRRHRRSDPAGSPYAAARASASAILVDRAVVQSETHTRRSSGRPWRHGRPRDRTGAHHAIGLAHVLFCSVSTSSTSSTTTFSSHTGHRRCEPLEPQEPPEPFGTPEPLQSSADVPPPRRSGHNCSHCRGRGGNAPSRANRCAGGTGPFVVHGRPYVPTRSRMPTRRD